MKLFETMMNYFDPKNLGLLGAVLGEHEVKVRDGVEAAVPEILSAIADRTATVEGRQILWRELRDTDHGVASSFADQLYYQNSQSLIETGNHQLSGLLGKTAQMVTDRVSRAADIGSTSARKIVGAVSPLIFSSLATYQKKHNLSSDQWETLFAEQAPTLRQHAIRASTPRKTNETKQKTFANFDTTDSEGSSLLAQDAKNPAASDVSSVSSSVVIAGAAAVAGTLGVAQAAVSNTANQTSEYSENSVHSLDGSTPADPIDANSFEYRRKARRSRPAFAANPAQFSFGTAGSAVTTAAGLTSAPAQANLANQTDQADQIDRNGETNQRWVPDTDNLKREREKERLAKLQTAQNADNAATNKNGGLGWLLWQLPLLLAIGLACWFFGGDLLNKIYNGPDSAASSTEIAQADSADSAGADENASERPKATEGEDPFPGDDAARNNPPIVDHDQSNATENTDDAPANAISATAKENDSAQSPTISTASGTDANSSSSNQTKPSATDSDAPRLAPAPSAPAPSAPAPSAPAPSAPAPSAPAPSAPAEPKTSKPSDKMSEAQIQEDVDFEIESTLTDLELSIKKIDSANTATQALPGLTKRLEDLEGILKTSSRWTDEEKVLVDLQLQDGRKLFNQLREKAFKKPEIKKVMAPLFQRLTDVLKTK